VKRGNHFAVVTGKINSNGEKFHIPSKSLLTIANMLLLSALKPLVRSYERDTKQIHFNT
jgi:hypothetical protein